MANDETEAKRSHVNRRSLLLAVPGAGLASALPACREQPESRLRKEMTNMAEPDVKAQQLRSESEPGGAAEKPAVDPVLDSFALGSPPWQTFDPFLFCVHHRDAYPAGNEKMGPRATLEGRMLGQDFAGKDGWSMYHGEEVPGFPRHPHRGFETVTVARRGFIDHSDSLGATARYGEGDVQWMTAGAGITHSEMFPLLQRDADNPAELFQIWLNLPGRDKFAQPHFSMFWNNTVPKLEFRDPKGAVTRVTVVAGTLEKSVAPQPPPNSWAAKPQADVAIWSVEMAPFARWTLPAVAAGTDRTLYFFEGRTLSIGGRSFESGRGIRLGHEVAVELQNGDAKAEVLLLQGRPIGEPVVQHGPFVMNDRAQILQAMDDYRRTGFGGWPWGDAAPVHAREQGRFARHADGRIEYGT